jgi:hypothetical protein
MNTVVSKLFATPISWLLAVPIVLLDRLMSPEMTEGPVCDTRSAPRHCTDRYEST